jgi:hypothetical protein
MRNTNVLQRRANTLLSLTSRRAGFAGPAPFASLTESRPDPASREARLGHSVTIPRKPEVAISLNAAFANHGWWQFLGVA